MGHLFHLGRSGDPDLRRIGQAAVEVLIAHRPDAVVPRFHLAVSLVQGGSGERATPILESLADDPAAPTWLRGWAACLRAEQLAGEHPEGVGCVCGAADMCCGGRGRLRHRLGSDSWRSILGWPSQRVQADPSAGLPVALGACPFTPAPEVACKQHEPASRNAEHKPLSDPNPPKRHKY